jgi:tryptophan 2,3-dioxygenase
VPQPRRTTPRQTTAAEPDDHADYLHLDVLLKLQEPRSSAADPWAYGDEHYSIAVQQCGELVLRQVLLDVKAVTTGMRDFPSDSELTLCLTALNRCTRLLELLSSATTTLLSVRVTSCASPTPLPGKTEARNSAQLSELQNALGLTGDRNGPLFDALRDLIQGSGRALEEVFGESHAKHDILHRLADAVLDLVDAAWQCRAHYAWLG